MRKHKICPECGTIWTNDQTCTDHFHMMLYWEFDHQLWDVHHLLVLSYHLQHPSTLSQEWMIGAKQQLVEFLEQDITPQAMRHKIAPQVDSGKRDYKIKATDDSIAHYQFPVDWTMTAQDVVTAGIEQYYASVQQWARSILVSLRQSNNM